MAASTIAVPVIAVAATLALLVAAAFHRTTTVAVALAAGTVLIATLRAVLMYLENVRMLRRRAHEAVTDGLRERILNIDPALRPVARLVRASHER